LISLLKPRKPLVSVEVRTRYLPNESQTRYWCPV